MNISIPQKIYNTLSHDGRKNLVFIFKERDEYKLLNYLTKHLEDESENVKIAEITTEENLQDIFDGLKSRNISKKDYENLSRICFSRAEILKRNSINIPRNLQEFFTGLEYNLKDNSCSVSLSKQTVREIIKNTDL